MPFRFLRHNYALDRLGLRLSIGLQVLLRFFYGPFVPLLLLARIQRRCYLTIDAINLLMLTVPAPHFGRGSDVDGQSWRQLLNGLDGFVYAVGVDQALACIFRVRLVPGDEVAVWRVPRWLLALRLRPA